MGIDFIASMVWIPVIELQVLMPNQIFSSLTSAL